VSNYIKQANQPTTDYADEGRLSAKALLRSVIEYTDITGEAKVSLDNLRFNWERLAAAVTSGALVIGRGDDLMIFKIIETHVATYDEVPSSATIHTACNGDVEVEERLKDLREVSPLIRTNFQYHLDMACATERQIQLAVMGRKLQTIATKGLEVVDGKRKTTLKGEADGVKFIKEQLATFEEAAQSSIITMSAADILEPLPLPTWLCKGLRLSPLVGTVMLAGYGDSGKTMFAQYLALCVCSGQPVFGLHEVTQGRVLHLDFEQGGYLTRERYQRLCRGMGIDVQRLIAEDRLRLANFPTQKIDDPATEALLRTTLKNFDLVIIDSFRAASPSTEENSSEARVPLDMLSRVAGERCLPLVIHHSRKPTKDQAGSARMMIRGSSALYDALGGCYVADRRDDGVVALTHEKERLRGSKLAPMAYKIVDVGDPTIANPMGDDLRWGLRIDLVPEGAAESQEDVAHCSMVLDIIVKNPGLSASGIEDRAKDISRSALRGVVAHLVDTDHVKVSIGARGARVHTALKDAYVPKPTGMESEDHYASVMNDV
jgi:hypothetical protein